jgi:guanylate kinase
MHATSLYIFLAPPSLQALEDRLRDRGTETEEKIQTRLTNARSEMEYKDKPDFWDHVIVNDDLDKAYTLFESAVAGEMPKAS